MFRVRPDTLKSETGNARAVEIEQEHRRGLFLLPFVSFLAGLVLWLVDAIVDVYLLDSHESFLQCLFAPRASELWMRTFVVIVLVAVGYFARFMLIRQDFLTKSLMGYQAHLEDLVNERTAELLEKHEELERLATTDPLTGILNRRKFTDMLDREMLLAQRYGRSFCLLLIDIDNFKQVNDSYGHEAGDEVLVAFCKLVQNNLRVTDAFCRWGGEEFMIMLPETEQPGGFTIAEKLRTACEQHDFTHAIKVTVSIGITGYEDEKDRETLLTEADHAMYQAKNKGRNRTELA